ncbi:MAG: sugar ABC transporter substrate-binding protein [Candidatus Sumerlaeaceae bacterium]
MLRRLDRFAVATIILVISYAAGWAESDTGRQVKSVRLTLWQGFKFKEVSLLRENISEFKTKWNAAHPERPLEITESQVPFFDMVQKLRSAALARQVPDIAFVDVNNMVQLIYGGVARPLEELPNFPAKSIDELREKFVPGAFDSNVAVFKGKRHLFGIPAQTTTLALFYNKKRFREKAAELRAAGCDPDRPPRDWNEFIRYGKVLTEPQKELYGFGMNGSFWFTMPFFNQYGAEFIRRDENGELRPAIPSQHALAALERKANFYLRDGIEAGAWRDGALDPDQGFKNNRYAMVLTGPWMIEDFRSAGLDFGVALIPHVPLDEAMRLGLVPPDATESSPEVQKLTAGNVGGMNGIISSTCKDPDVALEFLLFFASTPIQRRWAEEMGEIPVVLEAQKNLNLSRFPEVPTFIQQINTAKAFPAIPLANTFEPQIFNPEFSLVLQRRTTPQQALERIARLLDERILKPVNEAEAIARKEFASK